MLRGSSVTPLAARYAAMLCAASCQRSRCVRRHAMMSPPLIWRPPPPRFYASACPPACRTMTPARCNVTRDMPPASGAVVTLDTPPLLAPPRARRCAFLIRAAPCANGARHAEDAMLRCRQHYLCLRQPFVDTPLDASADFRASCRRRRHCAIMPPPPPDTSPAIAAFDLRARRRRYVFAAL